MRTTIALDPDADAAVRQLVRERSVILPQAVDEAIQNAQGRRA